VLPLTDSDEVIMVKQYRYPFKEVLLEIPAGKLEAGENPLECGKRELFEETGCTASKIEELGKLYPTPAYCTEVIHMYLARGLCGGEKNNLDVDEFLDVVKMPFDKVIDMIFRDEIPDAKTQLAMLKAKILLNN
jgi:ADP-ribose pyrophosphatase